ncbi:hypothetical protein BC826DRAFT_664232, partial [Russula brevipes]
MLTFSGGIRGSINTELLRPSATILPSTMSTNMKPPEHQETTLAQAPFDDTRADLILRSSDGVHFHVFKIILSLASPIFADMFSIPSPESQDSHDEVQVVTVSEHSGVLDLALRHLYPIPIPDAVPLPEVSTLAEYAHKYQVDVLEKIVARYLTGGVEHDPVGVYAIAVTYGYKRIGAQAAKSCLNIPFSQLLFPHLQFATAEPHAELLSYHVACGDAASNVASQRGWFSSFGGQTGNLMSLTSDGGFRNSNGRGCTLCTTHDSIDGALSAGSWRYGPLGLWNYLHRSTVVLARRPTAAAVTSQDFVLKFRCVSCPPETRRLVLELSEVFGREIQRAIEQVPLPKAVKET